MKNFRIPSDIIERPAYTKKAGPYTGKQIIKVFTGQRRSGKSYIMYHLMREIMKKDGGANIIYINKEDTEYDFICDHESLTEYIKSESGKNKTNYIFIDEVQEIKGFEKALRSLLLNRKNDIYITGSNARLLSGELATLLGGRTIEIRVHGLSYSEFLLFHSLVDSDENLNKYMLYGGLPFLVNLKMEDDIIFEYLKNIYNTIVLRDVVYRCGIRNIYFLEQLIRFLADNTGSLFSAKSISDFLKSQKINIPHNQVQTYTNHLADSFLINRVMRYDISGKRFFETGEKYYFSDTGIRNVISGYSPGDRSKIIENVIYNELSFRGYEIKCGWKGNYEIDFVAEKDNETIYVQATLALDKKETIEREFGNLLKIKDNYPKIVVSTDSQFRNTIKGIEHMNLRKFLLTEDI